MKHAVTKIEFHSRVARQLNRLMSKYHFMPYNGLIIEWKYSLDISCIVHIYKGVLICTGVRFVNYNGKKNPVTFRVEDLNVTFSPERVAVNIAKRVKNIMSRLHSRRVGV